MAAAEQMGEALRATAYSVNIKERLDFSCAVFDAGGSLIATVDMLKRNGCKQIRALVLVAAPEGIDALRAAHPDVDVYTAAVDSHLNEKGYIIPGLGDAGDKIFGTRL